MSYSLLRLQLPLRYRLTLVVRKSISVTANMLGMARDQRGPRQDHEQNGLYARAQPCSAPMLPFGPQEKFQH